MEKKEVRRSLKKKKKKMSTGKKWSKWQKQRVRAPMKVIGILAGLLLQSLPCLSKSPYASFR